MKFHALNSKTLLIGFTILVSFLLVNKVQAQCLWSSDAPDIYYLGKIGVGTTDPQTGIHLDGGSDYNASTITIQRNNNGWCGSLKFLSTGTSAVNSGTSIGVITFHSSNSPSTSTGGAKIDALTTETWSATGNGTAIRFYTKQNGTTAYTGDPQLLINHNGKIGISEDQPGAKLHINHDAYMSGWTAINTANAVLKIQDLNANMYLDGNSMFSDEFLMIGTLNADAISFGTNDGEKMRITSDGKVGIGTVAPSEALTVNGNIKAERIDIVSDVSSDFVFEDHYELRPLKEVEQYVKENKHLPEIPSAEELQETGYNVGTMDDLLLRKIEELTLYIIEQNKQLEELKQRIEEQE